MLYGIPKGQFSTHLQLSSYSKFLFTSIHLLLAFRSYNCHGQRVLPSALLLYDPTLGFFHSEHVPYATAALLVLLIFIILPPLLLLVYPTSIFKKCLLCLGFQRWDILHYIMDIFQGRFKDGTEGTRDYRSLSALYLPFRVALCFEFVLQILDNYDPDFPQRILIHGMFHVFIGMIFFVLQPHKQKWMNHFDGCILILVGVLLLLEINDSKSVYILGGVARLSTMTLLSVYATYHKLRTA